MEQDRAVSREVERGRVRGAGPVSPYLGQAANRLAPPKQAPTSHIHSTSALLSPREATMPRTLERLGTQPSSHQMPQDLGVSVVSVWDSEL